MGMEVEIVGVTFHADARRKGRFEVDSKMQCRLHVAAFKGSKGKGSPPRGARPRWRRVKFYG